MPRYIVKLVDKKGVSYWLEYSTVVDAPVTYGMTLEEFKEYYCAEYGKQGMYGLDERLERVEKKGTACLLDESVEETLDLNRAGPNGARLSYDEIVRMYCLEEEFDKKHPCWKQRRDAFNELYERDSDNGNEEEINEIFAKFSYPKKIDGQPTNDG